MKLNSYKSLAPVLVPLGILVILLVLSQNGRVPGKDGRAAEAAENPSPKPEFQNAEPVNQKSLVAKQPVPAAPAPLSRRQPPNGRRLGDRVQFLTDPAEGDPLDIALNYVRTPENRPGYTEEDFKNPKISSRYVSKHNGVTHLYLRQSHEGIEVYGGDIGVNLMPDGSIINLHNAFVTDLASEVNGTDPVITAQEAIRSAATFYSLRETGALAPLEVAEPDPVAKKQLFSQAGISLDPIPVKLTFVPLEEGVTRLAWNAVIRFNDGERWLDINVDAKTGKVLSEANWIACVKCKAHGLEIDEAHDCGEETPVIESKTSSVTGTNYNVFSLPLESPSDGDRSALIDPQNTSASPFGWHDTNGAAGAEFTDTRGNNVNAQEDADNNNTGGVRPSGGPSLNFDFPIDLSQAPSTYTAAVTANLFYWNNIIHDVFWHYGFDEPAGNFQENNYGNGGAAGDPVEADSQDGSGTNNANFGTPPDGTNPRMQMYIWTGPNPDRDSSLDSGIIIHEYGHGISNRLTGGPANSSALTTNQSRGMGEGWSDFLGLALTHQAGDTGAMGRGIGTYVLGQPTTGAGIRPYRYSTDLAVNPQHFGNLNGGGLSVPHGIGSVWCTALWELYWALVGVHGYNPNLYTGTGGNNIALQLVIDGMKLQPANPSFLDARDAILMADQVNNGGANSDTIWAAFAKRGMGFSADDGGSSSSLAVTAAFDIPDDLNITPGLRNSLVSTGSVGGPFAPSSQTYTLQNIGGASLSWTAAANVSWLNLSAVAGTLASSVTTTVNATINANANVLSLGIYPATVTFTNTVSGKTITRNVSLHVNDFAAALDSPGLTFGSSGVPWFSQTTTTQDGVDAAQSGAMGDSQSSSLQTTLIGPGKLTFWCKVSSEANYDFLRLFLNDVEQTGSLEKISGNVDWVQRTVSIPSGSQTVKWSYTKDSSVSGGSDAAWLDQLVWQPLPLNSVVVSYPNGGETVFLGTAQTISWAANITGNVNIDLFKGGSFHSVLAANESNDGSYSWSVSAGLPAASDYTVKVSSVNNPAHSDTSDATFTITSQPSLADALDTTGLTWLTSGNLPWFSQTATTNDGADAAMSGAITHNQSSSVETTLGGPGQLTFWWKVSSESNFDFLRFYINGVEQSGSLVRISGEVNWVQKTVAIPAGSQTVKWSYTKDGSVNTGTDAAWVDQVVFSPTSAPEIVVEQPVGTNLVDGSASISCGSADVGSPSSPVTFSVKNTGTSDLTGLALTKDGTHNADFTLGSLGSSTLAPNASTTFTVTFTPGAAGTRTAAIHLASNDANENPFDISLTGSGIGPGTLEVAPAGGLAASGNLGGPFSPSTLQYNLNNPGNSSIDWTAAKTATWLTLDATSGTLAAGANATVTATINAEANSLGIGSYNDTVIFTNTTSGSGDTSRAVSLTVNPIPATVNLSNLQQTYDGSPKPVTVTTTPSNLAHSVTYNGSSTVPTTGGTYAVVATITEPNYTGSASGNLVISYTVSYQGNGNTSGTAPANQTKLHDVPLSLATNSGSLNKTGFNFVGWNTAADGSGTDYPAGTSYSDNASLALHAKWAPGSDGTWAQTAAGPFDWGTSSNWNGGTVAAGADRTANFTPNITATQVVNLESARTIGNITFTDSTTASHDLTISGANVLTLARTSGTPTINVTNRSLTISSVIAGDNGLAKSGAGTLNLSGANTFSGGVTLSAGTLATTADANLGTGGGITVNGISTWNMGTNVPLTYNRSLTINDGSLFLNSGNAAKTVTGILSGSGSIVGGNTTGYIFNNTGNTFTGSVNNGYQMIFASLGDSSSSINLVGSNGEFQWNGAAKTFALRPFTLHAAGTGQINNNGSGALTIHQNLAVIGAAGARTLNLGGTNTGANTFSGNIANGTGSVVSLTKNGVGKWALSGTNTYSGLTTMGQANPIGAGLTFQGIQALSPNTDFIQVFSGGAGGHAPFRVLDDSATPDSRSGVDLTFNHSNNSMNAMSVFVGNNSIANGGTSSSTQTGSTIQLGNMNFNQNSVGQTAGTQLSVTGANGYKLQIGNVNITLQAAFAGAWPVRLTSNAAMIVGGNIQQSAGSAGTTALQLDGTASDSQITGIISNSLDAIPKALSLSKSNTSTWTLTGANTYTGATTISAGTLQLGDGTVGKDGTIENTSSITNNATLVFNRFGNLSSNVGISGTGAVTKTGAGSQTLSGTSGYTGITSVSAGKLFINGNHSTATGAVSVSADATLGGTGIIGGNTTIAANGKLEFSLGTNAANHDKLDLAATKTLTFSGASELTITSSGGASSGFYTLVTAPGGIVGSAPATLSLPAGWTGSVSKLGNDLVLIVTVPDTTPPTLVSITDDKSGDPVGLDTLVTYTVAFSEDMDASSVTAEDFGNAGSSAGTIGSITETSPGLFTVQVTPTSPGTLQLRVNQDAILKDVAGNNLDTASAIADDTILTAFDIIPPALATITNDTGGGPIVVETPVTYTLTFSEDITTASVEDSDFGNAATAAITIGTIAKTSPGVITVQVTPTSPGGLQLQVNAGAVITDLAGNPLDTNAAISDSTVLRVNPLITTVPNVVGLIQAAAGSDIVAANLVVGTITTQNHLTIPADSVISQNPASGASVVPNSAVDLVVSLGPPTYTVSYNANGATSGIAPTNQTKTHDINLTLATNSGNLARTEHIFSGWNTAADGSGTDYAPGGTYTDNAAVTLYAKWTPKVTPTVNTWPTPATIQVGQALSSATLSGGSASVAGSFSYNNPSVIPTAGIYIAAVTFTPNDTDNYSNVSGTVDVTVLTEFEGWAAGETTFSGDSNGDGVPDGLAWLLGAADPNQNASALMPVVTRVGGNMVMRFQCLKASKRGSSVIRLQTSTDLGANDAWSGHSVAMPETSGTVDGVVFVITPVEGTDFLQVHASVPMIGKSLFTRLEGIQSSP